MCWNCGSRLFLALDCADDKRSAFANRDDLLRVIGGNTRKSEQALELRERLDDSLFKIAAEMLLDEMRDYFRIRFGRKLVALFDEFSL